MHVDIDVVVMGKSRPQQATMVGRLKSRVSETRREGLGELMPKRIRFFSSSLPSAVHHVALSFVSSSSKLFLECVMCLTFSHFDGASSGCH